MNLSEVERAVLDRLAEGVHERLGQIGERDATRIDPVWLADAMLNAFPAAHPYVDLGPFYDTAGLTRWLGITRQALHQRVKAHQLLAPATGDGQRVYPAWQFTADGRIHPGLADVFRVLLPATDGWTAAIWLTTPSDRLGGKSAVEWLRSAPQPSLVAGTATDVVDAATEDAARWAQ